MATARRPAPCRRQRQSRRWRWDRRRHWSRGRSGTPGSARSCSPTCSRCTPTSSRSATATPTPRWPTGSAFARSFANNTGAAPALRRAARRGHGRRLHRVARRRGAGDRRRGVRPAGRGAGAARPRRTRAGWSWCSPGSSAARTVISRRRWPRSRPATLMLWAGRVRRLRRSAGCPSAGRRTSRWRPMSVVPVFAGVGAVASQLAPTRRIALELGGRRGRAVLPAAGDRRHGGRRRLAALGDAARVGRGDAPVRRRAAARAAAARPRRARCCCWSRRGSPRGRDIGSGLLPGTRQRADPRLRLLSSPTAQALRSQRDSLIAWAGSVAVFAFILGVVSKSVSSAGIPAGVQRRSPSSARARSHAVRLSRVRLPLLRRSRSACSRAPRSGPPGTRRPSEQLETLLALPVGRAGWLGGRLLLAAVAAVAIALAGRPVHLGGRGRRRGRRLAAERCSRPARTACRSRGTVPGRRRPGVRGRAPRQRGRSPTGCVTVALPVAARRLAARRAVLAGRPDAVRPHRARAGAAVPAGAAAVMIAIGAGGRARRDRPLSAARSPGRLRGPGGLSRRAAAESWSA